MTTDTLPFDLVLGAPHIPSPDLSHVNDTADSEGECRSSLPKIDINENVQGAPCFPFHYSAMFCPFLY